jgi:glycine N-methyltransferase
MNDLVFRTRTPATAVSGIPDQYADGKAARAWRLYVGGANARTRVYKDWLVDLLKSKGARHVLDVACGTGIDSVLLCDNGFHVTSCDASDKMLKYALKTRWQRRKEEAFDRWVIEEANWLALKESDIPILEHGYDAAICLGNSFAHLPDFLGNNETHINALRNFNSFIKKGGLLVIDTRNYDAIIDTGCAPSHNIYYQGDRIRDVSTSVLSVNKKACQVTLDYKIDISVDGDSSDIEKFRLSYYPHRQANFIELLKQAFGHDTKIEVLGDYKPLSDDYMPSYFIYVVHKN